MARTALPSERWKLFEPLYRGALAGETDSVEVTSTDENHWCRIQVGPLRDADGTIAGGVALAIDTTDLKRGESQYQRLLEFTPDAIVVVDEGGVIREANPECERLFGYTREELLGAPRGDAHPRALPRATPQGSGFLLPSARLSADERWGP